MKFITDLFKPKNEINTLYAKVRAKIRKEDAKADKKRTAYLNKITRKVKWNAKKKELATVPVIKFILMIVKLFTPKKRDGLFSKPDDFNLNFTADEINALYSKTVDKIESDKANKSKENTEYLDLITARVIANKNNDD